MRSVVGAVNESRTRDDNLRKQNLKTIQRHWWSSAEIGKTEVDGCGKRKIRVQLLDMKGPGGELQAARNGM